MADMNKRIACIRMYPGGFKIRSMADARKFLEQDGFSSSSGEWYFHSNTHDYCLNCKRHDVSSRPMTDRGDIFAPYVQVRDSLHTVWVLRKFINAQLFSRDC